MSFVLILKTFVIKNRLKIDLMIKNRSLVTMYPIKSSQNMF